MRQFCRRIFFIVKVFFLTLDEKFFFLLKRLIAPRENAATAANPSPTLIPAPARKFSEPAARNYA